MADDKQNSAVGRLSQAGTGWMWGMAGALLAVLLLASFKIVAERVRTLRPAAEFLSP